jgi:hypothetical protein
VKIKFQNRCRDSDTCYYQIWAASSQLPTFKSLQPIGSQGLLSRDGQSHVTERVEEDGEAEAWTVSSRQNAAEAPYYLFWRFSG